MAGPKTKAIAAAPVSTETEGVTLLKPRVRIQAPTINRAMSTVGRSEMATMMAGVAAPYETAASSSRMPLVGNPGPIALSSYHRQNASLARHFFRTDGTLRSAYMQLANAVVGTGPTPNTPFRELLPLWRKFASQVHAGRRIPLGLMIYQNYMGGEITGDALLHLRRPTNPLPDQLIPLHVHPLESERLPYLTTRTSAGNPVITGIEFDEDRHRTAYWLHPVHPNDGGVSFTGSNTPVRFDAADIIHSFRPSREEAERGESRAVAAMVMLWRLHRYFDAEMERKKLVASVPGFLKDKGDEMIDLSAYGGSAEGLRTFIDEIEYAYGSLFHLPSSTDVIFPQVVDSSGNASIFTKLMMLIVCASMGIPYELVSGDWGGVTDRVASIQGGYFKTFVEAERARLNYQTMNPLWHAFVQMCTINKLWEPPEGVAEWRHYEVEWSWPVQSYKHPVQDIQAKLEAMKAGLVDRDTLIRELGYDPETVDIQQCLAMERARILGHHYDSHPVEAPAPGVLGPNGMPVASTPTEKSEQQERVNEIAAKQIENFLAEMEASEADRGILGNPR